MNVPSWENDLFYNKNSTCKEDDKIRSSDDIEAPPYHGDKLGTDASKPPAKGFEWR